MANVTLNTIYKEVIDIKGEIKFLKHLMEEEYELSAWAKKELEDARKVPDSELISHDVVKRRILAK